MMRQLLACKPWETSQAEVAKSQGFNRALTTFDLTLLGVGVAVGSGIFVLTGHAAAHSAGPAVCIAFLIAAVAAGLGALCYAEMASILPVAGSAYAYAYATLGELTAFLLGWDLMLEYTLGAATVSAGWSGYAVALLTQLTGWQVPRRLTESPWSYDVATQNLIATGAWVNLPAVLIIGVVAAVLVRGVRGSSRLNALLVLLKIAAVLSFVVVGMRYIQPAHYVPFVPPNTGTFGHFGWSGVLQAASLLFFSYLGIDNLTTAALETKDPQHSLPRAIMFTLAICVVLYIAFALVLTGVVPYQQLGGDHPAARATEIIGSAWLQTLVSMGATAGLTSVLLVQLYAQPRIFFAMCQDGLLPEAGARLHARYGTPHVSTKATALLCCIGGGFLPVGFLAEMCSTGTLFAFILVSIGVGVLRRQKPNLLRRFRAPFGYTIPIASVAVCLLLLQAVSTRSLLRLLIWLALGVAVYFAYSRRHSHLALGRGLSTRS